MIVIIEYGMGNLSSISKALNLINCDHIISNKKDDIESASHIILPGVGHFNQAMTNLEKLDLIDILRYEVLVKKKPILGICLGMQLLFKKSEEECLKEGLGFLNGNVIRFNFDKKTALKIPHVGWNNVCLEGNCNISIMKNIENNSNFYFVHSYHAEIGEEKIKKENISYAKTDYGYDFISAIQKENIFGTQFHPEKSQKKGLKILKNFIDYRGSDNA